MKRACYAAFVALCVFAPNAFGKGFCTDDGTCFKNDPEFFKHYTYYLYVEEKSIYLSGKTEKTPKRFVKKCELKQQGDKCSFVITYD